MTEDDREQFELMWLQAAETYGRNAMPTDGALNLVFQALAKFELAQIATALAAHLNNPDEGRFAPKIADIVRGIRGDNASVARIAWAKVVDAIERVGPYESVIFDDPIIMAVVRDMGGWQKINGFLDDELPFRQQDFVVLYKGYLGNPPQDFPKKFIGLSESDNAKNGLNSAIEPILIGNPYKCLDVFKLGGDKRPKSYRLSDLLQELNVNNKLAFQDQKTTNAKIGN